MSAPVKAKRKSKSKPCTSSHGCSNKATEEHGCPFAEEIADDHDHTCQCCADCTAECANEV